MGVDTRMTRGQQHGQVSVATTVVFRSASTGLVAMGDYLLFGKSFCQVPKP
jgi:hypothetical protein